MAIRSSWWTRIAIATGLVLALIVVAAAGATFLGFRKMERRVAVPEIADWVVPTDPAAIERGRYLYLSRGCNECHANDGGGRVFVNDGKALSIKAPNISRGPGSVALAYTPADWTRLLRHGVKRDGRAAFVMPSEDYAGLTDVDLAALVAYLQRLPATPGTELEAQVPMTMMAAYGLGLLRDAAEKIDHGRVPPKPVPASVSLEHGAYVAQMCVGCHGADLSGGRIPGSPPDWPAAARLRPGPGSVMPSYASAEDFISMLRSGRRPDGTAIAVMPFESLKHLSEVDARALHFYLSADIDR